MFSLEHNFSFVDLKYSLILMAKTSFTSASVKISKYSLTFGIYNMFIIGTKFLSDFNYNNDAKL